MTSGNAGHLRVQGRLTRPHNGCSPLYCATVGRMDRSAGLPLLLGSFERHLRAANRADTTVATYLIAARQAEAFLTKSHRQRIPCATVR
jgi:hypothetical protein